MDSFQFLIIVIYVSFYMIFKSFSFCQCLIFLLWFRICQILLFLDFAVTSLLVCVFFIFIFLTNAYKIHL